MSFRTEWLFTLSKLVASVQCLIHRPLVYLFELSRWRKMNPSMDPTSYSLLCASLKVHSNSSHPEVDRLWDTYKESIMVLSKIVFYLLQDVCKLKNPTPDVAISSNCRLIERPSKHKDFQLQAEHTKKTTQSSRAK